MSFFPNTTSYNSNGEEPVDGPNTAAELAEAVIELAKELDRLASTVGMDAAVAYLQRVPQPLRDMMMITMAGAMQVAGYFDEQ